MKKTTFNTTMRQALKLGTSGAVLTMALIAGGAFAQTSTPAASEDEGEVVIIKSYRSSLQTSLNTKKRAAVQLDAINSEDIADFPDANLAESLQRIPGVSIDREDGDGRTISVRGLGPDFQTTRINGMQALSTSGGADSEARHNTSRQFDYNTFASELFNSLTVRKTPDAATDEGALGATVDLRTSRPFDFKGDTYAFSVQGAYFENGGSVNPRVTGLFSKRWADGRLGFLVSVAYSERDTESDQYKRSPAAFDYTYRGATFAGSELPWRAGFAAPTGTVIGSNTRFNNTVTGSNPAAYAKLYPNCGITPTGCADSTVRIPGLATLQQQTLHQERLGITASFQMQFAPTTRLSFDLLSSSFVNESDNAQLMTLGNNRNNTASGLYTASNTVPATTSERNTKRGFYPGRCTPAAGSEIAPAVDCGGALYGTALVPNMWYSVNPFNLDIYDYYNNPASVGYAATTDGLNGMFELIGRPGNKLVDANVNSAGVADYLKIDGMDWRSATDSNHSTTDFNQFTTELTHQFSPKLSMTLLLGMSKSVNENLGRLVEFNKMNAPTYTYDERNTDTMPVINLGFNAADPTQWGVVKGLSVIRIFKNDIENTFETIKGDFKYKLTDQLNLSFGFVERKYDFSVKQQQRSGDNIVPTEKEAGLSAASLGRVVQFGQGIETPAGTITSFFSPTLEGFEKAFNFNCNCINKYGDFRTNNKQNPRASFAVSEENSGTYLQADFDLDVFDRKLFGNVGTRVVKTNITANGADNVGRPLVGTNEYTDTLPSLNLAYEAMPNFFVRVGASKVMSRPLLANLTPNITAISVPSDGSTVGASMTIGNPKLKPFRATNYDFSAEWYFAKNGLLSLAIFTKEIGSVPQTVLYTGKFSEFLDAEGLSTLKVQYSDPDQINYINGNYDVTVRQVRDSSGGTLGGWEASYEQAFTFLPGLLKNTGARLNITHIESKLRYILDPGTSTKPQTVGFGPWLGASPDALNATLYYEDTKLSARVTLAKRAGYYKTFPISAGSCSAGDPSLITATASGCEGPLINDFSGSEETTNVDFSSSYKIMKNLTASLEVLNITDQTANERAYYVGGKPVITRYASTGRQVYAGLAYKY